MPRVLALILALTLPAGSSPSFAIDIHVDGVAELAVGATLQCRAYRPFIFRERGVDPPPIRTPLQWTVKPKGVAKIDAKGLLTALKPGKVQIEVEDVRKLPEGQLPHGTRGWEEIVVRKPEEMDGDRLPRLAGFPGVRGFALKRDGDRIEVMVSSNDWYLYAETAEPPRHRPPWLLDAIAADSMFNDDPIKDLLTKDDYARWEKNLKSARLTITSLRGEIARGTFTFATRVGVGGTVEFVARLPKR